MEKSVKYLKQEIERKYAVNYLPKDLNITNIEDIEQAFIYRDINTVIRIRKIQNRKKNCLECIYTLKTKGDIEYDKNFEKVANIYEIENSIQENEYNELIENKISNVIKKTRIVIPIENNLHVEMDVYYEYLDGFLTAEIEFPNEHIANTFKKPKWLGEEIGYKELSNWNLSNMTKEEWMKMVTKERIENNRKIIQDLKKNDKI